MYIAEQQIISETLISSLFIFVCKGLLTMYFYKENTRVDPYRNVIPSCVALLHGCSTVNLLGIFKITF